MKRNLSHCIALAAIVALGLAVGPAHAHPGGMAKDGSHMDRKTGVRHWHLEVPCFSDPCDVGVLPRAFVEHLDPVPAECLVLHDNIVAESRESFWLRDDAQMVGWALRGIRAGCWRVPQGPPGGGRP